MIRVMVLSVCATLWLGFSAMSANPQETNSSAKSAQAQAAHKFAELSDQFMKDSLAFSPSNASAGRLSQTCGRENRQDDRTGRGA